MNILVWNIRGSCSSKASLRRITNKYRPSVVAVLEPFLSVNKCSHWARWLRLPNFYNNVEEGGKVWLFWANGIEFQLHSVMAQALSGWFSLGNSRVLATFIYASCFQDQRRVLWNYLKDLDGGDNIPWFLGGDFNIVRSEGEKIGGVCQSSRGRDEFNSCIQDCSLVDRPYSGNCFSWCNGRLGGGRIWARLDRVLVNTSFLSSFPNSCLMYLPRTSSDHCPMVTSLWVDRRVGPTPFRFQRMWCLHEEFLGVVSECWRQEFQGCPMVKFSRKLKKLKQVLKKWNSEVFGKVEVDLKVIEEELLELENNVQQNYTQDMEVELLRFKQKHIQYLHREEIIGCQKSRVKWICEGDENTAFFHASLRCKKKFKTLESMILEDGSVLDSGEAVLEGTIDFFQQQLTTSAVSFEEPGMNLITSIITEDDNRFLYRVPDLMEVKETLWSIPQDSSPGPDGFSASFFHHAWDIIKEDLLMLAIEFFEGKPLTTFFGATNIVLIPKVDDPRGFSQFRPISLCSVVYKILSKVLVNRLEPIMKKIISNEQSAFIKGRSIFDNISIAQEMVQSMNKKVRGGNVMIKIDMAKAYDRVNWRFLLEVMKRAFSNLPEEKVKPFNANGGTLISHLFYADDVLIFSNGGKRSLLQIMKTLQAYQSMSRQMGNSVWAKFFLKKYVGGKHPMALYNSTGSRFWKGILSLMPIVQQNSCILIRSGACNFWFDNWLGDGAIANTEEVSVDENLLVADILNSSGWDVTKLRMLVSEEMVEKIIASPVQISGGSDVRIWQPNPDGTFFTKYAWHLIRETGPKFDRLHANDIKVLQELNCPISHVSKKSMKAIAWIKPNRDQYKLNVDGSWLRNLGLACGGGVIRDHDGRVLAGFAIHYGQVSNNVAEGRALLDGLKLAQQLGIRDILVESDSEVIDDIQRLFVDLQCSIHHIFREANMVADYLAKEGAFNGVENERVYLKSISDYAWIWYGRDLFRYQCVVKVTLVGDEMD
ncbi:uncharacterized protein LOC122301721 [Carya illinoinensis]|uniref:uncharacterized protein LOC122301721 n=1 Tax=Carya illinoinensis TaxID=32201 RepID=UPI001C7247CF|nr:uncharacterized protein LOC122301721 [Carya illinoinensis]